MLRIATIPSSQPVAVRSYRSIFILGCSRYYSLAARRSCVNRQQRRRQPGSLILHVSRFVRPQSDTTDLATCHSRLYGRGRSLRRSSMAVREVLLAPCKSRGAHLEHAGRSLWGQCKTACWGESRSTAQGRNRADPGRRWSISRVSYALLPLWLLARRGRFTRFDGLGFAHFVLYHASLRFKLRFGGNAQA